jgi:hypothetical protein
MERRIDMHAPTPYIALIHGGGTASLPAATGFIHGPRPQAYDRSQGFHPDDAMFIVMACNAHDALVAAVQAAKSCINDAETLKVLDAALDFKVPVVSPGLTPARLAAEM